MAQTIGYWERRGERFWRAHHEAWKRRALNQREYCEVQRIPLKAFGNWRQIFMREPEPAPLKLLHRPGGLSHTLSHMAYSTSPIAVPPVHEGRRRRFNASERQRLLAEADQPGSNLSEVARRHGLDRRMMVRWKQDLATAKTPEFVQVIVSDGATS